MNPESPDPAPLGSDDERPKQSGPDAAVRKGISDSIGRLNPQQQSVANQLRAFDPALEGLYTQGLWLSKRPTDPGIAYLLAHAGREISRGVIRHLSGGRVEIAPDDASPTIDGSSNEKNRQRIADVLELPLTDAVVSDWFRAVGIFSSSCHYQAAPPPAIIVGAAFNSLERLLFAVLTPFFDAKPEIDRLLQLETPTSEDFDRLKSALARRALRDHFFNSVSNPSWAEQLQEWGFFDNPPDIISGDDGKWTAPRWLPGRYLTQLAAVKPDLVVGVFARIQTENKNPLVWRIVTQAAAALPATALPTITRRVTKAVHVSGSAVFARDLIPFAKHASLAAVPEAFGLVEAMLAVQDSESASHRGRWLKNIDEYELDQVIEHVLPALSALDIWRTLELLLKKLARIAKVATPKTPDHAGSSRSWCRRLERSDVHDEAPVKLAKACIDAAVAAATDSTSASRACEAIKKHEHEIFERVLIRILATVGNHVTSVLDQFLVSDAALEPPFGIAEVAFTLRKSFALASPAARRLFVHGIERGPSLDFIAWEMRQGQPSDKTYTSEEISARVIDWQESRLLWFQDELPIELLDLANRIGHVRRKLSFKEEALAYDGFYVSSGPSVWETDTSPNSVEELRAMALTDLIDHLRTWQPPEGPAYSGYPSVRELANTFEELVATSLERVDELIVASLEGALPAIYVQKIFSGVSRSASTVPLSSWNHLLELLVKAITTATEPDRSVKEDWVWTATEGLSLIRDAARGNRIPQEAASLVWDTLRSAVAIGGRLDRIESVTDPEGLVSAVGSQFSGRTVETIMEFALACIRQLATDPRAATAVSLPELDRLLPQIEEGTIFAQATIGRWLPWCVTHAGEWAAAAIPRLSLHPQVYDPLEAPIWGAYVLRSEFYFDIFDRLRPVYLACAKRLVRSDKATRGSWGFNEHFLTHLVYAMVHGRASLEDGDQLIQIAFRAASVDDRGHSYWEIWRILDESKSEPLPQLSPIVLAFWAWRLSDLEADQEHPNRSAEGKSLTWLILSPNLPAADSVPLALRTIRVSQGELAVDMRFWERTISFVAVDPKGTIELVEMVLAKALKADMAEIVVPEARPTLEAILSSGNLEARQRTVRLVHRLGESGFHDFEDLAR